MKKHIGLLLICLILSKIIHAQQEAHTQLQQVIQEEWAFREKTHSLWAYSPGHKDFKESLNKVSVKNEKIKADYWKKFLLRLQKINRQELSVKDRINYDMLSFLLKNNIKDVEFETYLVPILSDGGFHIDFVYAVSEFSWQDAKSYEDYILFLQGCKNYMEAYIAMMREGIKKGVTMPKVVLEGYESSIDPHVVDDPTKSYFYQPLLQMPASIPVAQQKALQEKAFRAIKESVVPGYKSFSDFLKKEYRPAARTSLGASALPNGKEYYAQKVSYYTTLDMGVDEVFELGQKEVKRIHKEMEAIIAEVGFKGSFKEFFHFLRTDKQFYCDTPICLLKEASYISKKIDGKLPQLFKTLPQLPYGVAPVPSSIAPKYTTGRYIHGSAENHKAGFYWVNTYNLKSRPLYVLPALTLHEAVPGHHLQISLTAELEGMPEFRKHTYLSAYGEGWALYSEWLGVELGIYETPYQHFGRLAYEMWRACRLVVDTGLHAKGWSRQQAIDFMGSNTSLALHEIQTEVDRYIAWPGQAISYKIGELKIKELRQKAEQRLKEKFDIREFHEVILSNGSVPLFILEELVENWLSSLP